ncbi:MAG TPA: cupredoxin family protein [Herbaspirillum sp.]|nr:cupredoxin family protein [Herbaspirillum sp.]
MKMRLLLSALVLSIVSAPLFADESAHDTHAAAANPAKIDRTIAIDMSDNMRFTPKNINIKRGETIRFIVKNSGHVQHEMVIGSMAELKAHAKMMRKMPGMMHADENQVTVDPGQSGELVRQFTKIGAYHFACLQPGHFEAGMAGLISVKEHL